MLVFLKHCFEVKVWLRCGGGVVEVWYRCGSELLNNYLIRRVRKFGSLDT